MNNGRPGKAFEVMKRLARLAGYTVLAVWLFGGSLFFFLRFSFEFAHQAAPGAVVSRILDGRP